MVDISLPTLSNIVIYLQPAIFTCSSVSEKLVAKDFVDSQAVALLLHEALGNEITILGRILLRYFRHSFRAKCLNKIQEIILITAKLVYEGRITHSEFIRKATERPHIYLLRVHDAFE